MRTLWSTELLSVKPQTSDKILVTSIRWVCYSYSDFDSYGVVFLRNLLQAICSFCVLKNNLFMFFPFWKVINYRMFISLRVRRMNDPH